MTWDVGGEASASSKDSACDEVGLLWPCIDKETEPVVLNLCPAGVLLLELQSLVDSRRWLWVIKFLELSVLFGCGRFLTCAGGGPLGRGGGGPDPVQRLMITFPGAFMGSGRLAPWGDPEIDPSMDPCDRMPCTPPTELGERGPLEGLEEARHGWGRRQGALWQFIIDFGALMVGGEDLSLLLGSSFRAPFIWWRLFTFTPLKGTGFAGAILLAIPALISEEEAAGSGLLTLIPATDIIPAPDRVWAPIGRRPEPRLEDFLALFNPNWFPLPAYTPFVIPRGGGGRYIMDLIYVAAKLINCFGWLVTV